MTRRRKRAKPAGTFVREVVLEYRETGATVEPEARMLNSNCAAAFLRRTIPDGPQERCVAVALDSKNRPVAWSTVGVGSLAACPVAPGDVFRFAILSGCSSLLVAHNHPSGDPTPSADDFTLTERLARVGRIVGVNVVDHVILGRGSHYSFLDQGLMPKGD